MSESSPPPPQQHSDDPFAGQVRLNQLSPQELLFRNDHMSGDPNLRQYTSMTYDERCQKSREYYLSLSSSSKHQSGSTEGGDALPLGWNERMNVTPPITDIKGATQHINAMNNPTPAALPAQQIPDRSALTNQLLTMIYAAGETTKAAQRHTADTLAALRQAEATKDETAIAQCKRDLEQAREEQKHAQNAETMLMGMMQQQR